MLTRTAPKRGNTNARAYEERRQEMQSSSREARELLRATSYVTDEGEMLARELPRQNMLSRITTNRRIDKFVSNDASSEFIAETLRGLYRQVPDKASFVLRERRIGTMTEMGEGRVLPNSAADVLRRQEHLECGVVEMSGVRTGGRGGLGMVREAFVQEFRDLYEIVGSMEARKLDVCKGDVYGLFEWFKMVENFLRVYVTASQCGYVLAGHADWGISEKRKVVRAAERVEAMKRVMVAMDVRCGDMVGRLRRRVEEFVESVVRFLEEESSVVGTVLEMRFNDIIKRMSEEEGGKEVVVLLGRGSRDSEWGKRIGGWRAVRRVKERHWDYVGMFVAAEQEYRTMYGTIGEEIATVPPADC